MHGGGNFNDLDISIGYKSFLQAGIRRNINDKRLMIKELRLNRLDIKRFIRVVNMTRSII
jgi:hypothetical protein